MSRYRVPVELAGTSKLLRAHLARLHVTLVRKSVPEGRNWFLGLSGPSSSDGITYVLRLLVLRFINITAVSTHSEDDDAAEFVPI